MSVSVSEANTYKLKKINLLCVAKLVEGKNIQLLLLFLATLTYLSERIRSASWSRTCGRSSTGRDRGGSPWGREASTAYHGGPPRTEEDGRPLPLGWKEKGAPGNLRNIIQEEKSPASPEQTDGRRLFNLDPLSR